MALLEVKVTPGSSRDRILGWMGRRLKIAVQAPADRDRANEAVVLFLAEALGLSPRHVRIVRGHRSPLKSLEIDLEDVEERLKRLG
jgi:uncharacterized protein (TIGR00251 family)